MDPAADSRARPGTHSRELLPAMRALLAVFGVLTALAVIALLLVPKRTDRMFTWTIQPPLTAAFPAVFAAPATAVHLESWPLTTLAARVVAAWLIAFGATAPAAVAGDLQHSAPRGQHAPAARSRA